MASMPLALSVHNFINSVGADAGFASVIALAILILLYFAHARETASLRDEAASLSQRLGEAEARLAYAQRAQEAPAAEEAGQPAARIPGAPAGVAAPALAAATRFIPVRVLRSAVSPAAPVAPKPAASPAPATIPARAPMPSPFPPASPQPAAAPVWPGGPVPAAPAPAPVVAAGSPHAEPVAASVAAFSRPAPATAAGGANGVGHTAPTGLAEAPRPAAPGGASRPGGAAPRRPGTSADFPRAPSLSSRTEHGGGRAWSRFGLLIGALVVVAAAAAAVILTTGTGTQRPSSSSSASNASILGRGFKPSHVTVAVLNGTAVNQLAHHVAAGLTSQGYKKGLIATASNQTLTNTQVAYLPGRANRIDALHVARALHLPATAVTPVNQATLAVACPPPGSCTANVVVTVGSNLAQS
jgi:hypothetical protein